jgi:2,3-bisphosphoglycerate-dependent phosphoglycerate mutase
MSPVSKTTLIYAVRHGETEWNLVGKQQGHWDSPLTPAGLEQAHALARGLTERGIEVIYASDLGRALRTAEIIACRLGLDVSIDPRLRERNLGAMQGLTKVEFVERYPQEMAAFNSGDPEYILPGGESTRQRYDRCVHCAEDLAARHPGARILIVAHGGVLDSFIHRALHIPLDVPRRFSLFNGSINSFSITDGQWRLDTWGELGHLGETRSLDDN